MADFDRLRTDESLLSLINLCRDLSIINEELIKRSGSFDRMFAAQLQFNKNILAYCDWVEDKFKVLDERGGIAEREYFPELKL